LGYTHYWSREKDIEPDTYQHIVHDFQKLIPILEQRGVRFDLLVETFSFPMYLEPEPWKKPRDGKYSQFCKTEYASYDAAVKVFLVIAKHYLGDKILVSSDGKIEDWQDALALCQKELSYGKEFKLDT
jgi:hypothetical protein